MYLADIFVRCKKSLGSTYRFKVVIFDPCQVFLAVILVRPCWLTVTQTGEGYARWLYTLVTGFKDVKMTTA
jgi:hypothetical protein